MTPVQLPSSNPEIHHSRAFPLSVDPEGLGWLARQTITFHVYDDSLDNDGNDYRDGAGAIGTIDVPLKPLSDGHSIEGFFKIKGRKGKSKDLGELELALSWRNDLLTSKYSDSVPLDSAKALENDSSGKDRTKPAHNFLGTAARDSIFATFGLPRGIPASGATRVEWQPFLSYVLRPRALVSFCVIFRVCSRAVVKCVESMTHRCCVYVAGQADAQVEWRLLVVEALNGDMDRAESQGLAGQKLQQKLESEDRDGDGFVTVDEVRNCLAKALPNQLVLGDEHVAALVKHCDGGNVEQICRCLELREPTWLPIVRREIKASGFDHESLDDRFRSQQQSGEDGVSHVSKQAFLGTLEECGISFE